MRSDYMRVRRLVLGAALPAALVAVALYAMAVDVLHMPAGPRPGQVWAGVDFHTYLAGASVALHNGWASLYDQDLVIAAQERLVPAQFHQPYLSPPPVALLVAPLTVLPFWMALMVWSTVLGLALVLALGWSTSYRGGARIAAVALAMAPWWVLLSVYVGQVVPLVAAALLVSWRLARQDRDMAAGLVLALIALKPNTAILVPFALLAAGRWRVFAAWAGGTTVIVLVSLVALGADGTTDYMEWLRQLPGGGTALTLGGAFGVTGLFALACRTGIVAATLVAARMLRASPGIPMAAGAVGSLLVSPYLHNSDLCVLVVAAWMVWEEAPMFRVALVAMWLASAPFMVQRQYGPTLQGWVRVELALFAGLVALALLRGSIRGPFTVDASEPALTASGDLGRRAPA